MAINDDRKKIFQEMERKKRALERAEKNNIVAMDGGKGRQRSDRHAKMTKKNIGVAVLWSVVFLLFLVYVGGYTFLYLTREKIAETNVVLGSVDSLVINDGVIIRDEKVYKSNVSGVSVYGVMELTRVRKGEILCSIEDEDKVLELESQISSVNTSIMGIQADRQELSIFDEDVKKSNASVKRIIDNMSFYHTPDNISLVYSMSEKIYNNIDFRNKMLFSEDKGNLKSHTTHKEFLAEQLQNARHNVVALETGVFSTNIDNQEESYNFDNMEAIPKERTVLKTDPRNLAYDRNVHEGSPLFKIVKSNEWYIATYIPSELITDWTENSYVTIYVETTQADIFDPLEVKVYKMEKTTADDIERYVILKSTKFINDYIGLRGIRFKVQEGIQKGLKIPISSVVEKTLLIIPRDCVFESSSKKKTVIKRTISETGVMTDEPIPITTFDDIAENDYITVVLDYNKLKRGDVLNVSGKPLETKTITEIENAKGVYVTNSGTAQFVRITLDENSSKNSEYLVLNPEINRKIKVHDRIVADVKTIKENQLVY